MNLNEYQRKSAEFQGPTATSVEYLTLGLVGEAGEVAEKIKKLIRDGSIDHEAIAKELGDVLWYLARLSNHFTYSLNDIAQINIDKLTSRKTRGKLQGNGDNR
jgi:NTP pyrophosphatase (non-canonical NTP hydrolase)